MPQSIPSCSKIRRVGPDLVNVLSDCYSSECEKRKLEEDTFFLLKTKLNELSFNLTWTGYHTLLQNSIPPLSTISYLPIIDANATDMAAIQELLKMSVQIADRLHQQEVVVVADQAIYAKAQQLRWQVDECKQRLVLRLGEFHTLMSFISAIGWSMVLFLISYTCIFNKHRLTIFLKETRYKETNS